MFRVLFFSVAVVVVADDAVVAVLCPHRPLSACARFHLAMMGSMLLLLLPFFSFAVVSAL